MRSVGFPGPALLALLLTAGSADAIRAEPSSPLYLVDSSFSDLRTRIYQLDPATAVLAVRAELGTTYTPVLGMAAASGSVLYLTGTDAGASALCAGNVACLLLRVEMDPVSTTPASIDVVGPVTENGGVLGGITGMTFRRDGSLYAISQDTNGLYILDPATAAATRLGTVDLTLHGGDITFDGDDRLWLWSNIGAGDGLYEVDPTTFHAALFDPHPDLDMSGLAAVGHSNSLRGVSPPDDHLYEIDSGTGLTGNEAPLTLDGAPFDLNRGDLDSPFCADDPFCEDANPCTLDACAPGGCRHLPQEGCCLTDSDCPGTTLCAIHQCAENRCVSTPVSVEDGDACTLDICDPSGGAVHLPMTEDADEDGVLDCRDQCPDTRPRSPVEGSGCSIPQICPCDGPGRPWINHGEFVSCVTSAAARIFPAGARGGKHRSEVIRQASRSSCGKTRLHP